VWVLHLISVVHVLSLPIRNWNASRFHSLSSSAPCFEPTYKELKPLIATVWIVIFLGFEPTYKELKQHINGLTKLLKIKSFEPTYKELKLGSVTSVVSICPAVLSLPIRNWNPFIANQTPPPALGFEPTYKELKRSIGPTVGAIGFSVLSLPIRNWNPRITVNI